MKAGWEHTTLGSVCEIISGAGFPKKHQGETDGEFPLFKVGDMNSDGNETHLVEANHYISETTRKALGARILPPASVVFPKVGGAISTNKKRRLVAPSCVDNNVMGLAPNPAKIDPSYLAWWMDGVDIYEFSNKAALPSITKGTVDAWPIPLPPLEEQKQIVAVLDAAFEGLTRARIHIETNLQNARELFERSQTSVLDTLGTSAGEKTQLGKVVTFHNGDRGKNYPNRSEYVEKGVPWINTGHILPDGSLSSDKMHFITREKYESLRGGHVQENDLVFCLRGATIGKTAFVSPYKEGAVASSLMIIRATPEILPEFAYIFLTSELGRFEIERFIGGAAQPNLAGKSVGEFNLFLPDIATQHLIVKQVHEAKSSSQLLQSHYRQKLQDLDDLRQSLLQKAFAGELT